jgi:hypothetical protein
MVSNILSLAKKSVIPIERASSVENYNIATGSSTSSEQVKKLIAAFST